MTRRGRPRIWVRLGCTGCSIPLLAALAIVTVIILAGCGGGAAPDAHMAAPPLVCQHYATQLAWARSVASPTLADAVKWQTDIDLDVAESHGHLHQDALAMQKAGSSTSPAAHRMMVDCQATGVKFGN